MSYILDALQRADAERERGNVPGLHTPTGLPAVASSTPGARRAALPWWALALITVAFACAGVIGWWWFIAGPAPAQPRASAPAVAPQTAPVAAPAQPGMPPTVIAEDAPPPAPILAPAEPARAPVASPGASAPTPATTTATTPATTPSTPSPASQAVRRWAELPAETRAQLPAVSVSGSTWSQNPAHRMLIANGQVLQEGQTIAPGLVLERIDPNSAVLNHRGLRYSISY
jgi:general secretion pathway protein B